jgi:signal transduction histidine kinase
METYDVIVEADDITEAVVTSLSRIFLLLLLGFGGIALFFSARIFRPFNQTLDRIRNFRVRDRGPLDLPETGTREFARLNHFIEQMAEKSRREYQALKEFSENASHEIQTPLAIARSKLELLLESPHLSDQEIELVGSAQESINKLSKLGRSLSLLTKIENEEFGDAGFVDFSRLVERAVDQFSELAELKDLRMRHQIEAGVALRIDPVLADVLLTNLLQNAVRHNYEGGCIEVRLDSRALCIQNTGQPPQAPPEEFFRRFRKDQQSGESLGLGLAIVKRICELNQLDISYRYLDERHQVCIGFDGSD